MEQTALYDIVPWTDSGSGHDNRPTDPFHIMAITVIPAFKCPSDPNDDQWPEQVNNITNHNVGSYLGCAGGDLSQDNATTSGVDARTSNGIFTVYNIVSATRRVGPQRFASITDGLSNTVMVAESPFWLTDICTICDRWYLYTYDLDVSQGSDYSEFLGSTYYGINLSLSPDTTISGAARELSFGSFHPGGCNLALGDASCRFVSETIDITTWRALGSRKGKETIGDW
jgi:hypothetical protein